jgi:hypothetical protein
LCCLADSGQCCTLDTMHYNMQLQQCRSSLNCLRCIRNATQLGGRQLAPQTKPFRVFSRRSPILYTPDSALPGFVSSWWWGRRVYRGFVPIFSPS